MAQPKELLAKQVEFQRKITPNPQDTPTESLTSLTIDNTVYGIAGGGGNGSIYTGTTPPSSTTGEDSIYLQYVKRNVEHEETAWTGSVSTSAWASPVQVGDFDLSKYDEIVVSGSSYSLPFQITITVSEIPNKSSGNSYHKSGMGYAYFVSSDDGTELWLYSQTGYTSYVYSVVGTYTSLDNIKISDIYGEIEDEWLHFDLSGKQDVLTAGDNITINNNVISANNIYKGTEEPSSGIGNDKSLYLKYTTTSGETDYSTIWTGSVSTSAWASPVQIGTINPSEYYRIKIVGSSTGEKLVSEIPEYGGSNSWNVGGQMYIYTKNNGTELWLYSSTGYGSSVTEVDATIYEEGVPTNIDNVYGNIDGQWLEIETGGSNVIPNPSEAATQVLNTISIDNTVYEIQGGSGSGSGYVETILYDTGITPGTSVSSITLNDDVTNYNMLMFDISWTAQPEVYRRHVYLSVDELILSNSQEYELYLMNSASTTISLLIRFPTTNTAGLRQVSSSQTAKLCGIYGLKFGSGSGGGGFSAPDYDNPTSIPLTYNTWTTYNVPKNGYVMVDLTAFTGTPAQVKVNGTLLNSDKSSGTNYILNSTYMFPVTEGDIVEIFRNYSGSGYASDTALFLPAKISSGSANIVELTQDEYSQITPSDDTLYLIYGSDPVLDPNYNYYTYGSNDEIVVRVYHEGESDEEILWFFKGFTKTASDWAVPSELQAYTPQSGDHTSAGYSTEDSITQLGWIGWAVGALGSNILRSWTTNWYYTQSGTYYAVVDINGDNATLTQYYDPYVYTEETVPIREIYYNGRKYSSDGLQAVEISKADYDALSQAQKTDTSKLYMISEPLYTEAFNMVDNSQYKENGMTFTVNDTETISVWDGSGSIGGDFRYITPIDLTNLSKIKYNLVTRTCYDHNNSNVEEQTNSRFHNYIFLFSSIPSGYGMDNIASALAYNDHKYTNTDYGTQEIDVSSLTGTAYIVWSSTGWNATISNITLESDSPIKTVRSIYYNGNGYASNATSGTSGDSSTIDYSTEEQVIGTWIDGKPLYRQVIEFNNTMAGNTTYNFTSNFSIDNTVRNINGTVDFTYSNVNYKYSMSQKFAYQGTTTAHNLVLNIGTVTVDFDFVLIIEYTKTTD